MSNLVTLCQHHPLPVLAVLLSLAAIALAWLRRDRRIDTIPGPPWKHVFLGIGYRLPPKAPVVFRQWAQQYGDIFRIRVGWYDWVVINTPDAVREILEKQAVHTSSKIPSPMGHDIVTGGNRMPTMPYNSRWKGLRAIVREITTVPMTASFIPSQEFEAKQLLFDLAVDNENQRNFYQHMRRFAFSIIMTTCFGTRVQSWDHPDAQNAVRSQAALRRTSRPGAFIVDEIPPLAKIPERLRPGRRVAQDAAAEVLKIKMDLWNGLEKQVRLGKAPPSFAREIYEKRETWHARGLTVEHLAWVSGGLVEAGFETTAATLNSLILHLAADERVRNKAGDELTRVVGPDRLPTQADLANLPYVRACVKEMLRMNPILAPGIRFFTDADVVYKGHIIPKGTVLLVNTAHLHFDPERFERPFEFWPERYLDYPLYSSEYAALSDPYRRDHFTFSTGRRTCPGARLAENSLGIALAGMLWAFDIRPPLIDGVEQCMDTSDNVFLDEGFTIPKPFAARFVPRSEDRLRTLKTSWETAKREGYSLRGHKVDVEGVTEKS